MLLPTILPEQASTAPAFEGSTRISFERHIPPLLDASVLCGLWAALSRMDRQEAGDFFRLLAQNGDVALDALTLIGMLLIPRDHPSGDAWDRLAWLVQKGCGLA